MNKKIVIGTLSTFALGLLAVAPIASAQMMGFGSGRTPDEVASQHASMFENQASLLGLSVEDVKSAWAKGENMRDLMEKNGIKEEDVRAKMQQQRIDNQKSHLATLVSKGVITQAQADARLAFMQTKASGQKGERERGLGMLGGRGHGRGVMGGLGLGR